MVGPPVRGVKPSGFAQFGGVKTKKIPNFGRGMIFGLFPVYFRLRHAFKSIFRRFRTFAAVIYRKQGDLYHFMNDFCPKNRHFPKIFAARLGGG